MRLNCYHSFAISAMYAALATDPTQGKKLLNQINSDNDTELNTTYYAQ